MTGFVEPLRIHGRFVVRKFWAGDDLARATPYEVLEGDNLVLDSGATALWQRFAGAGAVTAFDAANARLCVGNGTTPVAAGQTGLQGASQFRKAITAAPTISSRSWTATAQFLEAEANFAWAEVGLANAASGGVMFDRALQDFGVKTNSVAWTLSCVLTA